MGLWLILLVVAGVVGFLAAAALVLVVVLFVMRRKGPAADGEREPGKWGHSPPRGSE
jgi:hypothetical protein